MKPTLFWSMNYITRQGDTKIFGIHLNAFMLVFIGKLSLGTLSDEYPCARVSAEIQLSGFGHFFRFLHHFVLAKLATGSIRVKYINYEDRGTVLP